MSRDLVRQAAVVVAFIAVVVVNMLANVLPLNGVATGEISARFPVLFTPAGYVFSIWGVIYLLLAVFTLNQARPDQRDNPRLRAVGWWFVASSVFNILWLFLWHYGRFALTEVAMLALLATLLVIYLRLDIARSAGPGHERWWLELPFSVYLGWITVATVANSAVVLYDLGWNGGSLGPVPWTLAMLTVGAAIGVAVALTRRDAVYPLVLVWAYIGIWVARQGDEPSVALAAAALALVLAVAAAWTAWTRYRPANGAAPAT